MAGVPPISKLENARGQPFRDCNPLSRECLECSSPQASDKARPVLLQM